MRVAHTADLDAATLHAIRALLDAVYAGDFEDDDWEHTLGGLHVLAHDDDGALIGHGAVVQRRLLHGGRALRAGYVEGVAVRADRQRQGIGAALLAPLERVIRNAYDLGALGTTDAGIPFYTARGWQLWRGPSSALTPDGLRPTPEDDGGIYVLPTPDGPPLDLDGPLTCDWRDGDVW